VDELSISTPPWVLDGGTLFDGFDQPLILDHVGTPTVGAMGRRLLG
jgi:hypothetical protein